jgi:ribulose-phosphate 3-epimerase
VLHDVLSVKIAPSILAADFARLGEHVREAQRAGADRIHVDVMDGHFVPNISMGAPIVASLRPVTRLLRRRTMMVADPDTFLREFIDAGSDSFLVHVGGDIHLHRTCTKSRRSVNAPGSRSILRRPHSYWRDLPED